MRRTPEIGSGSAIHAALRRPEVPVTELAEDQPTARLTRAHHLPDRLTTIIDKARRGVQQGSIGVLRDEWKIADIPFDQIDLGPCGLCPATRGGDPLCRGVDADDPHTALFEPDCQRTLAAADVHDTQAACRADPVRQKTRLQHIRGPAEWVALPVGTSVRENLERGGGIAPV